MLPDGDDFALAASAARGRVELYRLERERDAALRRVRAGQNIVAAWKPLSSDFLSAKAKLQPRDSKGRWIEMGSIVRWMDGTQIGGRKDVSKKNSYSLGRVESFDAKTGKYNIKPTKGGADIQLEGKNLEVVQAAIPDSPEQAAEFAKRAAAPGKDKLDQKIKVGDRVHVNATPDGGGGSAGYITSEPDENGDWGFTVQGGTKDEETRVPGGEISVMTDKWRESKKNGQEALRQLQDEGDLADAENWSVQQLQSELINLSENHLPDPGYQEILDRKQAGGDAPSAGALDVTRGDELKFNENPFPNEDIDVKYDTGLVQDVRGGQAYVSFGDVGGWVPLDKGVTKTENHYDLGDPPAAEPDLDTNGDGEVDPLEQSVGDFYSAMDEAGFPVADTPLADHMDELHIDANTRDEMQFDGIQEELDTLKESMTDAEATRVQSAFDSLKKTMIDHSPSDLTVPDDFGTPPATEGELTVPKNWTADHAPDAPAASEAPAGKSVPDSAGNSVQIGDKVDWKLGFYGGKDYPVVDITDDGFPVVENPHSPGQTTVLRQPTEDSWGTKKSDVPTFTKAEPDVEITPEIDSVLKQLDSAATSAGWGNDGYDKAASGREGAIRETQKLIRKKGLTPDLIAELQKRSEKDSHANDYEGYGTYNPYYAGSSKQYADLANSLASKIPGSGQSSAPDTPDAPDAPAGNVTEFAKNMFQNLHPDSDWDTTDQSAWLDAAKKAMENNGE